MSRHRSWCFTINNWTDIDYEKAKTDLSKHARYWIMGKEIGPENGTPHIQGYVSFKNAKSSKAVSSYLPRANLRVANGSAEQNKVYCSKDNDHEEFGDCPKGSVGDLRSVIEKRQELNKRIRSETLSDLVDSGDIHISQVPLLKKALHVLAQDNPSIGTEDVRGVWIWGDPGVGKSHLVREVCGKDLWLKPQSKWWCGYEGQSNVLLDDMDDGCLKHYLKIWADKYACTGEVKGGVVNLRHKRFFITSNYPPEHFFGEDIQLCNAIRRRFKVHKVLNREGANNLTKILKDERGV